MKNFIWFIIVLSVFLTLNLAKAQSGIVKGVLENSNTNEPIMFAAISLHKQSDSSIYLSTITNDKGAFSINQVKEGNYFLKTSCLGFIQNEIKNIAIKPSKSNFNCGIIEMEESLFQLEEVQATAYRARAKTSNEKTTYIIKNEMSNSSHTGTEVLKFIPGIQMDLKKNIYLEGNSNVIILINGKERDKRFLDQISPGNIDRIDVSRETSSNYEGEAAGVINIILKKEKETGFGGNINLELPVTYSAVFVNPSASFSYGKKNLSVLLSYTGSLHYFDIDGSKKYDLLSDPNDLKINNNSTLQQKNWNHRINLSIDYFMNEKNSFTFYSYYNPFKNEFTGDSKTEVFRNGTNPGIISYSSKELDRNAANLFSLFYNHTFDKPSTKLTIDVSRYSFSGNSSFTVWDINQTGDYSVLPTDSSEYSTNSKPERRSSYVKVDFTSKINNNFKFDVGSKYAINQYLNSTIDDFKYSQKNISVYSMLTHTTTKLNTTLGLRGEYTLSELKNEFAKNYLSLLPYFVTSYKLTDKQNLKFSYNKSIIRPGLYDLNPGISPIDLYSMQQGDPNLKLGNINKYAIKYTLQGKNKHLSFQLFYKCIENKIHQNGTLTGNNTVLFTPINVDRETRYGVQASGSVSLFKFLYLMPYVKLFKSDIAPDNSYYQSNKSGIGYATSLSAIVKLKDDLSVSLMYQHNGAEYFIQNKTWYDAQYFFSIDKKFANNLKIGISTAVPFTKAQSYLENEFRSQDFNLSQHENIRISTPLLWFKLSYKFNSGKKLKQNKVQSDIQEVENKKGF